MMSAASHCVSMAVDPAPSGRSAGRCRSVRSTGRAAARRRARADIGGDRHDLVDRLLAEERDRSDLAVRDDAEARRDAVWLGAALVLDRRDHPDVDRPLVQQRRALRRHIEPEREQVGSEVEPKDERSRVQVVDCAETRRVNHAGSRSARALDGSRPAARMLPEFPRGRCGACRASRSPPRRRRPRRRPPRSARPAPASVRTAASPPEWSRCWQRSDAPARPASHRRNPVDGCAAVNARGSGAKVLNAADGSLKGAGAIERASSRASGASAWTVSRGTASPAFARRGDAGERPSSRSSAASAIASRPAACSARRARSATCGPEAATACRSASENPVTAVPSASDAAACTAASAASIEAGRPTIRISPAADGTTARGRRSADMDLEHAHECRARAVQGPARLVRRGAPVRNQIVRLSQRASAASVAWSCLPSLADFRPRCPRPSAAASVVANACRPRPGEPFRRPLAGGVDAHLAAVGRKIAGVFEIVHRAPGELDVPLRIECVPTIHATSAAILHVHVLVDHDHGLREHELAEAPDGVHDLASVSRIPLVDRDDDDVVEDARGRESACRRFPAASCG